MTNTETLTTTDAVGRTVVIIAHVMSASPSLVMMASKHMNFTLTVDNEGKQCYTSGSTITGTVTLELSENMTPINNISVVFLANATVEFCDDSYRTFRNSAELCHAKQTVWSSSDHHQKELAAGIYQFRFAFQIPNHVKLPSSFEIDDDSYIKYMLFAGISQTKPSIMNHKTASKEIQFIEIVDINTPGLAIPHEATKQRDTGYSFFNASDPISFSVKIQRVGYCLGESIAISATAKKIPSREKIIALRASLTQNMVTSGNARYLRDLSSSWSSSYITRSGSKQRKTVFNQKSYRVTSVVDKVSYWDNVLLPIPSQSLPPTTLNCAFIEVSYALNVTLVLCTKKDISVEIPICIGTVPFRCQQPALPCPPSSASSDAPIIVSETVKYVASRPTGTSRAPGGP